MLVLLAGLGQPSLVVVAVEVLHKLYLTINRIPVGMHIERAHKDTNHQSLVVEVGVLLGLFYYNNFTIGGGYYQFICIAIKIANRTTIEVQRNKPCCAEDDDEYPERYACV